MTEETESPELETIPHTLKNGIPTVKRADQAVWFDRDKGLPEGEKPGWYFSTGVRAPDETPKKWRRLKNGEITVQREDGGAWFDQDKGLPEGEKPGWYDKSGKLLPDLSPGEKDELIARKHGYDPALVRKAAGYKPGTLAEIEASQAPGFQGGKLGRFAYGVQEVGAGINQLGLRIGEKIGLATRADVAFEELQNAVLESKYLKKAPETDLMRLGGNIAATAPVLPFAGGYGAAAALGAVGGAIQPTQVTPTEGGAKDDFWKRKSIQVAGGTVAAPVTQLGLNKVVLPAASKIGKGISAKAASFRDRYLMPNLETGGAPPKPVPGATPEILPPPSILSEPEAVSRKLAPDWGDEAEKEIDSLWSKKRMAAGGIKPEYQEIIELAKEHGLEDHLTAADITGNPLIRKIHNRLIRQKPEHQAKALEANRAIEARAREIDASLQRDFAIKEFDNILQVEEVAKGKGKRALQAKKILSEIEYASDDFKKALQVSGNMRLLEGRLRADKAYSKLEEMLKDYGNVPLESFENELKATLNNLKSSIAPPDKALYTYLDDLSKRLKTKQRLFGDVRALRSDLGDNIRDYQGNQAVGKKGIDSLQALKISLENDMEKFATSKDSSVLEAWKDADEIYKKLVVPFKEDKALSGALVHQYPDKLTNILLSTKGSVYQKKDIFNMLDSKAKSAVRNGVISEAFEYAKIPQRGDEGIRFSPAKWAGWMERHRDTVRIAFGDEDKYKIDGFYKLMRHLDRSSMLGADPLTGQVNEDVLLKILDKPNKINWYNISKKVLDKMERKKIDKIFGTPEGNFYLMQAARAQPGTDAMNKVVERMYTHIPALRAGAVVTGTRQKPEVTPEPEETPE